MDSSDEERSAPADFLGVSGRPGAPSDISSLGLNQVDLEELVTELTRQRLELARFRQIIENINRGLGLDEVLDFVYDEFRDVIPYNRISYAALDSTTGMVVAKWVRSDQQSKIPISYSQPLSRTRLGELLESGRPRIINDLQTYLAGRPYSASTRLLLADGMRSSLTCPLIVEGRGVGFLFFDSSSLDAYSRVHVDLFQQIAGVVAVVIERGRMYSELSEQKAVIEEQSLLLQRESERHARELELARTVQRALIPGVIPNCGKLRMGMVYEPAEQVGGDLLDCIPLEDDGTLVYMADAMGHGVPAALVMSVVRTAFHAALGKQPRHTKPSPAALLREVNQTLVELFGRHYVTAVCARIDQQARTVTLSLAGHPPALHKRGTSDVLAVSARSIPLGISAKTTFVEVETPFEAGDTLLLYTDGVVEAASSDDTEYGITTLRRRLEHWSETDPDALVQWIRRDVRDHCAGAPLEDDLTLLAIQLCAE